MANRSKFKISQIEKKTKRGKGLYLINTLFVPEEIAASFQPGFFSVKRIGDNIIYTHIKESKTN
jgi:hypothetical protein